MIQIVIGSDHRNWDLHLREFRHAVNTAKQESTKVSPAFLNYGRQPKPVKSLRREIELENEKNIIEVLNIDPELWKDRLKRLQFLRDLVAKYIDDAREKQKLNYDKGRKDVIFREGEMVLRKNIFIG